MNHLEPDESVVKAVDQAGNTDMPSECRVTYSEEQNGPDGFGVLNSNVTSKTSMNYSEAYPSVLPPMCPPQVLISDHSVAVPLLVGPPSTVPPFLPLMASSLGSALPGTTPPSVLSPSPPVLAGPLPHVFVSDHSEVPRVTDATPKLPPPGTEKVLPSADLEGDDSSPLRRSSEPAALPSVAEKLTAELADKPKRPFRRYASVTPRATSWGKRLVVFVVAALVVGLAVKIGSELWEDSYGENTSSTVVR